MDGLLLTWLKHAGHEIRHAGRDKDRLVMGVSAMIVTTRERTAESCHLSEAKSLLAFWGAFRCMCRCATTDMYTFLGAPTAWPVPVPDLSPPSLSLSLSNVYILPSARLCAHVVIAPSSRSGRAHGST